VRHHQRSHVSARAGGSGAGARVEAVDEVEVIYNLASSFQ
jgi:hypothetical protein